MPQHLHEDALADRLLLQAVQSLRLPYIYAAIDKNALQKIPLLGSAHPVDVAFRMCCLGIDV